MERLYSCPHDRELITLYVGGFKNGNIFFFFVCEAVVCAALLLFWGRRRRRRCVFLCVALRVGCAKCHEQAGVEWLVRR